MNRKQLDTLESLADEVLEALKKCSDYNQASTPNVEVGLMLMQIHMRLKEVIGYSK